MPVDALEELTRAKNSWEKQKNEKLKDARICDAHIESLAAAIQLLGKDPNYKKETQSTE